LADFGQFAQAIEGQRAAIITGRDSSGKTFIAKKLQVALAAGGAPAVLINGERIRNSDIQRVIRTTISQQYGETDYPASKFGVIIDDFDECQLPDTVKESIIRHCSTKQSKLIAFSYSVAPSVLFAPDDLPDPDIYQVNPIGDEKLLDLVTRWKSVGHPQGFLPADAVVLPAYNTLHQLFGQAKLDKYPSTAVTFLQFLETLSASDIATSSFAACYDALLGAKITMSGSGWRAIDEAKSFLSMLAYAAYVETGGPEFSSATFDQCLADYSSQYLSETTSLRKLATDDFITTESGKHVFAEEYIWYFLCARYVARTLWKNDKQKYVEFIDHCTHNIFLRKFANIIIFVSYFSEDNEVIRSLLVVLDGLFSKAPGWVLSDKSRSVMLGLTNNDPLSIESAADVSDNRREMLRQNVANIIEDAEGVVARYTLPFLDSDIGDSEYVEQIDYTVISADSYMKSTNALMRIHSVLGQILSSRPGTFETKILLDCIKRMVQASGRYIALNHAIAAVLIVDRDASLEEVDRAVDNLALSAEEKLDKVERIFSFWSVYLSQAGLARYLNSDHSIRGLKLLVGQFEREDDADVEGNIPFNFSSVLTIAQLYKRGSVDRREIEDAIEKYGENSAFVSLLRVVFHIYSYYMPMSIEDKQWVATKLRMSLQYLEAQRRKAISSGRQANTRDT
jgi:hypothetical protein